MILTCPFLVVHGAHDRLVPVQDAATVSKAAINCSCELKIFDETEGGVEHCQGDNFGIGADYIANWLEGKLRAAN